MYVSGGLLRFYNIFVVLQQNKNVRIDYVWKLKS